MPRSRSRVWHTSIYVCLGIVTGLLLARLLVKSDVCSRYTTAMVEDEIEKTNARDYEEDKYFMFVGVITARKFLATRARVINMVWAKRIPGKVLFFIGDGEPYHGDLNVVELKGVPEDSYPPQIKSFAMLEYMNRHYAGRYKWLIRVDDDIYIKAEELSRFLKGINNTRFQYIGQPGTGRGDEKGRLGLRGPFCMGGPGVIMSAPLVQHVAPNLSSCLKHTKSIHEDTELGRCIFNTVGITCTASYEMRHLLYQNYKEIDALNSSFKKELGNPEIRALTLHPVKEMQYVFRLENFINFKKLQKWEEKRHRLNLELQVMDSFTNMSRSNTEFVHSLKTDGRSSKPLKRSKYKQMNLDAITHLPKGGHHLHPNSYWDCITGTTIHSHRFVSAKMMFPVRYRGRLKLKEGMNHSVEAFYKIHTPFKKLPSLVNYHYQRLSASHGITGYVFFRPRRTKDKRKLVQSVYYRAPFDKKIAFREATEIDECCLPPKKKIVLVMAVFKRSANYQDFMAMYVKAAADYHGPLELHVTIFKDKEGEYLRLSNSTSKFRKENPHLPVVTVYSDGIFNRGKGMMMAAEGVSDSCLLLFMDVDMTFTSRFLHRVAVNTVRGRQAFFPIYFTHFDSTYICYKKSNCHPPLESRQQEMGFWRSFSYGVASMYKSDLLRCGGFRTNITGWGIEDVDLYEKCIQINLALMRVADPGIYHRYHERDCDPNLPEEQLSSCLVSGAKMRGSVKVLTRVLEVDGYLGDA